MQRSIERVLGRAREARDAGKADEARTNYALAAKLARAAHAQSRLAFALRHMAEIDRESGFPRQALASAQEAAGIYRLEPESPPLDLANALRVAALSLDDLGRAPEARSVWAEARGFYEQAGVAEGIEECRRRLNGESR